MNLPLHHVVEQGLMADFAGCQLPPPASSALPPLPPVPLPIIQQTYRKSSLASSSKAPRAIVRPRIPSDSYLLASSTLHGCVEAFNRENSTPKRDSHEEASTPARRSRIECKASLHYDDSALCIHLGLDQAHAVVWVFLRTMRRDGTSEDGGNSRIMEVDGLKMSPSDGSIVGRGLALCLVPLITPCSKTS